MENIPQPLLLAISMAACLGGTLIRKHHSGKFPGSELSRHLYNVVTTLTAAITLFVIAICEGGIASAITASPFTVLLAAAFGIVTALQQLMVLKAFEIGPLSYTTVITSLSMLIPTLSGVLFFSETISALQYVGIALMVVCLVLSVNFRESGEKRKASLKWLIFCAGSFIFCGLIGVMQKWHQSTEYKGELNAFLIIAFTIAFIYSTLMCLIASKNEKKAQGKINAPFFAVLPIIIMAVAGICGALNNVFNLYLSGVMDSAVFFPLVNGGGLILTTVSALIFFRERLKPLQWVGLAFGVAAVFMLCI